MKKGKRKKDPSREGGTKGGLFGFWPNTPYKCVHPVGLFSWVWGKGIWNDTLTVIMWTPYHLQKSQQQKTRKHPKRRAASTFVLCTWKNGPEWKTSTHKRYHARWMMSGWETLFHQYSCSIVNHGGTPVLSSAGRLSSSLFSLKIWVAN
jgi:hypothetical protein